MFAPAVIKWAREVSGLDLKEAAIRIGVEPETFRAWEDGKGEPTRRQVERMAPCFNVPFSYLLDDEPPEKIPLPEGYLRTPPKSRAPEKPSFNLYKVMWAAESRQNWLSEYRRSKDWAAVLPNAVPQIMDALDARIQAFGDSPKPNLGKLMQGLIHDLWEIGFMVIRNSVVGYGNPRKLDVKEFSGFALADEYAPVIFMNGNASKAEQMLTLLDGLKYLLQPQDEWTQASRSDAELASSRAVAEERAAYGERRDAVQSGILDAAKRIREVAQDILAAGRSNGRHAEHQPLEGMDRMLSGLAAKSAGKFWNAVPYKSGGPGFLSAVVSSTLADETPIRDAFNLTGIKGYAFDMLAVRMGFPHVLRRPDAVA